MKQPWRSVVQQGRLTPNGDFWTGQMYVQYVKLEQPQAKYPLMLWHGGGLSGACWEATPDGREGWQSYFLKQGHDVYLSDSVERGRASWSRYPEIYKTEPIFRPYAHAWESFRIGPKYHADPEHRQPFPGSQYPVQAFEASMLQAMPRWSSNNELTQAAYDEYIRKIGPCVIISHSQGCGYAAQGALNLPQLVKGLVYLEPSGMPSAEQNDLAVLQAIPQLYLWGDFLDCYSTWNKSDPKVASYYKDVKAFYEKLQQYTDKAQ